MIIHHAAALYLKRALPACRIMNCMSAFIKPKVEAILFLTGQPLAATDIAQRLRLPLYEVEEALMELMQDYAQRSDSGLELDDSDERGYMLQVKPEYQPIVDLMLPMEISQATIRTLSAIALKAPIKQSELVVWRGGNCYEHIQELLKHKLISKQREGRSYMLNVTARFHQYFKIETNLSQLQLRALMEAMPEPDEAAV
jgi:segregation and condensation protein B